MAYNPPGGGYPYGQQPPPGQQPYGAPQQQYGVPSGQQPAYNSPQYSNPGSASNPYGGAPYGTPSAPLYGAPSGAPPAQYGATPGSYGQAPSAPSAPSYGAPPSAPVASQYGQQGPPAYGQPGAYGAPAPHGGQPGGYGSPYPGAAPQQYNVPPEVSIWFQAVDQDRSGYISAQELQKALINTNREFRYDSVRLLFNMVDKNRVGKIDVNQFGTLIKFINDWRPTFDRFDAMRSGAIDANNLAEAFKSLGFQLSPQFCALVIRRWSSSTRPGWLEFDGFLAVVVLVRTFTDKFASKDLQRNGTVRINFEEFLTMMFDSEMI